MRAKGFTLIELAIVIVIVGILMAMAVPRFADLTDDARNASKEASYSAVRSAYAIAIAKKKDYPTVQELLNDLEGATFANGKIQVTIGVAATDIANLYTDTACSTQANALTSIVKCIQKAF